MIKINDSISYKNPKVLEELYWKERLSLNQIAQKFGVAKGTIKYTMEKFKIPLRSISESIEKFVIPKETLVNLYLKEKMTTAQIAEKLNVSRTTIENKLREYCIPIRSRSERMTKFPKKSFSGDLQEKAYMMSLRSGDINAYKHSSCIRIQTSSTHPAQIQMVRDTFEKYSHIGICFHSTRFGESRTVYSDLNESFNFLVEKTHEIPGWIMNNKKYFLSFLAGYMDCEGNWEIAKSNENDVRFMFRIRTYDKTILEQIKIQLEELGFATSFYLDKKKGDNSTISGNLKNNFYGVRIYSKLDIIRIVNSLLPLSRHSEKIRKMKFILENKDRKWNEIKEPLFDLRNGIKDSRFNSAE